MRAFWTCKTDYTSQYTPLVPGSAHWVLRKGASFEFLRVTSQADSDRLCRTYPDLVFVEKFPSLTELHIFCAGASTPRSTSVEMERSGIVFAEEGVEIQSFAVPLISRKKGLMLALPVGLIKSGLLSPGGPIDEDAVVGPSHIFEVDLILEDELTGAPYSADTKVEVLVADFSNDVLPLLRDYDPVSDSTEGIRGYDERHPTGIPTAPDLLTTVMTWAESDMASRAHFYSAREEPGPKTSGVAKRPPAKRMTTAALAEQIATLSAQVSLLTAQQRQGLELEEKPMVVKSPPPRTPAIRAPEPNVLVAQGMAPKMPAVSAGLQSPEIHRSSRVLQLAGPPPKTRASPGTSGLALLPSDEPYDPVKAPLETPEQILASQAVALNALVSHLIQGGDSLSMDFHAGGAASSSTKRHREKREATAGACLQAVRVPNSQRSPRGQGRDNNEDFTPEERIHLQFEDKLECM